MNQFLTMLLAIALADVAGAQVMPPVVPKVVSAVKVPASAKVKPCQSTTLVIENPPAKISWVVYPVEGIVIWREHSDDATKLKLRLEIVPVAAKKANSTPSEYALTVNADGELKVCVITVDGVIPPLPPPPDPPPPVDPLEKLALAVAELQAAVAKIDARVAMLEKVDPRPPPPPPNAPTLSVLPLTVAPGGTVTLRWTNAPAESFVGISSLKANAWAVCVASNGTADRFINPQSETGQFLMQMFDGAGKAVPGTQYTLTIVGGPVPPPPPPIPTDGLKVLIVYESSTSLPSMQQAVLTAKEIRDYLIAKCTPTPDGGKRGWYIADKDANFSAESKFWQDMMKRSRQSIPWIIISNGATTFEGPLPADIPSTIQLLKKYGG